MKHKEEIIEKFENLVNKELNKLEKIKNPEERLEKLDTLFKIHKILNNFDELKPVLENFFLNKEEKDKWGER